MQSREYFTVKQSPAEIFSVFEKFFPLPIFDQVGDSKIIFFRVDSDSAKKSIETTLMSWAEEYNPKAKKFKLISNKRKALIFAASIIRRQIGGLKWKLEIYQEHAKGCIIEKEICFASYYDVGKHFSPLLAIATLQYQNREMEFRYQKMLKDLIHEYLLLELEDLHLYFSRDDLTSFEKKQIVYTRDYYSQVYDEYSDHIDDGKTYKNTISKNEHSKIYIELCDKCIEKFINGCSAFIDVVIEIKGPTGSRWAILFLLLYFVLLILLLLNFS